jgi:DNA sulfur modification protein DndB
MKQTKLTQDFTISFPAIRGIQANREYYVTMCPLKLLKSMFPDDNKNFPPEIRAQRELNKNRVTPIRKYIIENQNSYVFSSIAASIDREVSFQPYGKDLIGRKIGTLSVPMDSHFIINDGQHRLAAIKEALKEDPSIEEETISIVIYIDSGLKNSQQMFADLNRYAVRPTKSLGILYDHRDPLARLSNKLANNVKVFKGMTEKAKSSISNRSRKLFTLSGIYQATKRLLQKNERDDISEKEEELAIEFWNTVGKNMPDWIAAVEKKVATSELRSDYVHAHGIALQALAIAGNSLIKQSPSNWQKTLSKINEIDWARENTTLWEGRALIGGSLNKSQKNVTLTANYIKQVLNLPLEPKEEEVERKHVEGQNKIRRSPVV